MNYSSWKTAWKKLESEIDGYADEKWKPNVYRGDASMSFYKAAIRNRRGRAKPGMPVLRNYRSCVTR